MLVWEDVREEKDFWTVSKRLWQTVRKLRREKQCSTYSAGGVLLTSTENIVWQWKEYFEDLLSREARVEPPRLHIEGSELRWSGHLVFPPDKLEEAREREIWASVLRLLPQQPSLDKREKMDEWMKYQDRFCMI